MPKLVDRIRSRKSKDSHAIASSTQVEPQPPDSAEIRSTTPVQITQPLVPPKHIGLFELSKDGDEGKTVDVVAVHGLQGHPYKTWKHKNGHLWLQDSLPKDIPFTRIMTFGYDSTVAFSKSVAKIDDKALDLLNRLSYKRHALRDGSSRPRPIVFICHSLGGIVVKKALILAHERRSSDPHLKDILDNTKAIAFLGVPHKGSDSAWWAHFAASALKGASVGTFTNTALVADLKKDSSTLSNISKQFIDRITGLKLYTFFERKKLLGVIVVDESSARIGSTDEKLFPVEADHRTICHCPSGDSQEYQAVGAWIAYLIKSVVEETKIAPDIPSNTEQSLDKFRVPYYLSDAPEIDYFVGRESIMVSMEQVLLPPSKPQRKIVVLHGLGGIGKTQSAIHYAGQHRQDYTSILWFNAKHEDSLRQSFKKNASRFPPGAISQSLLDSSQNTSDLQALVEAVKRWLAVPQNNQWLLIFDNLDNPKIPQNKEPSAYDIRPYFPEASQGSIILTTRWSSLRIGKSIKVLKLDDQKHSISILAETSGRAALEDEPDVLELVETLDGLPLALATAGSYLSLETMSVTKYLQRYRQSWSNLQQTSPELLSYEDRTLYSTWNISFSHIRQQDSAAINMLQLWAYFDNQDLWFELLAAGTDDAPLWLSHLVESDITFDAVMRKLCDHGLIYGLRDSGGYGMHHCVHAWTANVLNHEMEGPKISFALSCVGYLVPLTPRAGDSTLQRRLLPHANRCLQLLAVNSQSETTPTITSVSNNDNFNHLGILYYRQGKLAEAEEMFHRALKGFGKAWGPDHTSMLCTVNNLGNLYSDQGKLAEAEEMYVRALKGYEKACGPDHTSTLTSVNNLGNLYSNQCKLAEAEEMYQRALKGKKKAWGPDHTSTLDTVNDLGILYSNQGKLTEAEEMYVRALKGYEKAFGPDHTSTLDTVNNLGTLYWKQGKLAEAEEMLQRAVKDKEKAWGLDHTSTLMTVNNLGLLYYDQGRLTEAEMMYVRALKGKEKAWGPDHTSTLSTVSNLGNLYSDQGKLDEAEEMYVRALKGYEKAFGPDHTSTLDTVNNLGLLYSDQGGLAEAEEMHQRALKGKEKAWGPDHTSTLDTINNLGNLYSDQGKLAEAEKMYVRALKGYEKAWGPNHVSTLDTVKNLGNLYLKQGRLAEAEKMYVRALKGYENARGPNHTSTLSTVNSLGNLYSDQGKLAQAEEMYVRALKGREKARGPDHTSTLETINNLGNLYSKQGMLAEAEELYQRALKGYEKALGLKHKITSDTAYNIAAVYQQEKRYEESIAYFQQAESGYRAILGPQHPETVDALNRIEGIRKLQEPL